MFDIPLYVVKIAIYQYDAFNNLKPACLNVRLKYTGMHRGKMHATKRARRMGLKPVSHWKTKREDYAERDYVTPTGHRRLVVVERLWRKKR